MRQVDRSLSMLLGQMFQRCPDPQLLLPSQAKASHFHPPIHFLVLALGYAHTNLPEANTYAY